MTDTGNLGEVLGKSMYPLLVTYMPLVLSVIVAWIVNQMSSSQGETRRAQPPLQTQEERVRVVKTPSPIKEAERGPQVVPVVNKKKKQGGSREVGGGQVTSSQPQRRQSAPDPTDWLASATSALDFNGGNKFISPCVEDDPGGISGSSSSSEANKENNSPGRLSRRQRKNRVRKDDSSPLKKKSRKERRKKSGWGATPDSCSVLKQYCKLNAPDIEVYNLLKNYCLTPEDLMTLGYPVESKLYPGRAMIFKSGPLDANAKEFVPREESVYASLIVQSSDKVVEADRRPQKQEILVTSEEKKCMRCSKSFFISSDGEYLTQEHCTYHWGKLQSPPSGGMDCYYTCCKARQDTKGCTNAKLHVWSGVEPGRNGPFDGYVRTRQRRSVPADGNFGVYALDCEMCFTNTGLELTKISVVGLDGKPVYETFVRPESFIIDYNTRFSGITAKDMSRSNRVKSLKDVQNDLMGFISADTILIGHGLENDLRALRMVHQTVVDTAVVFPHALGLPYKRSLKSLSMTYLRKDIQNGAHDSYEDASSCLELILWKVRKDLQR